MTYCPVCETQVLNEYDRISREWVQGTVDISGDIKYSCPSCSFCEIILLKGRGYGPFSTSDLMTSRCVWYTEQISNTIGERRQNKHPCLYCGCEQKKIVPSTAEGSALYRCTNECSYEMSQRENVWHDHRCTWTSQCPFNSFTECDTELLEFLN